MNEVTGQHSEETREAAMARYIEQGRQHALSLGNRGPLRLDDNGKLAADILEAYWEHGFYVFDPVISQDELEDLRADVNEMIERAPVRKGAMVDRHGRPALGRDWPREPYDLIKPLSDPWGGTDAFGGRHQTKMYEPKADAAAPEAVVHLMYGMCEAMPAALRLYGHPKLLAVAEAINGPDFVPYNDAIFVKQPGVGGSVSWHQDGITHWDSPDWDEGSHGFNFQVQLYGATPATGLWGVPGTHKTGRVDLRKMLTDNGGSDMLPGAVPLYCEPGGVTIANRQLLHGSFANDTKDPRISITFGFHRLRSVLGVHGALYKEIAAVYDEERISKRSSVIQVAIDARQQKYPDEPRYSYNPFAGREESFRFNDETFASVIKQYYMNDLAI